MLFNETIALFVCSNGKKNLILQQIYTNRGNTRAILVVSDTLLHACPALSKSNRKECYN